MIMGFFRRIGHLFKSAGADYVFILREASPVGPPVFEWLLSKIFRKKLFTILMMLFGYLVAKKRVGEKDFLNPPGRSNILSIGLIRFHVVINFS